MVPDVKVTDLRPFGAWVCAEVTAALEAEALRPDLFGPLAGDDCVIAKTASRSVLGFMNDMTVYAEYAVADAGGLAQCDIGRLNRSLRRGLHNRGGHYATAMDLVSERPGR